MAARTVEIIFISLAVISLTQSLHVPPDYPYAIETTTHTFKGRVCSDAIVHQPIMLTEDEPAADENSCTIANENFIKLIVRNRTSNVIYTNQKNSHGHLRNSTGHNHNNSNHKIELLPDGLAFDVILTNAFDVDDDFLIIVSNTNEFHKKSSIEFYIVLVTQPGNKVVSNPLPFIVTVDRPISEPRHHGAVIFAGVIALLIIGIVLTIPVTVFIKRRRRKGKPICMCCVPPSPKPEVETKVPAVEANGGLKGSINPSMIFNTEMNFKTSASESSLTADHETIQDHQLRSVSHLNFQPTWLNPHYRDSHYLRQQSQNNNSRQDVEEKI